MLTSSDALKNQCNKEQDLLQRCSMALPVLSSPDINFALTRDELDKSCIELNSGIRCIDNYTNHCMEQQERIVFKSIYAGIIDVVRDLCKRGDYQDRYLQHASCVKNVRPEYEHCSKKYEHQLMTLNNHQRNDQYQTDQHLASSHEENLKTVCCSFQEYLSCSERTVQASCGEAAASFTSSFLKRMASAIIKNFCLEYNEEECRPHNSAAVTHQSFFLPTVLAIAHLILYLVPA
ncbi:hypothetical protein O0L34_g5003 [Tuta absoluta]|nr:hypothetical protein O0L34_g5003 [Tuta absoluta]